MLRSGLGLVLTDFRMLLRPFICQFLTLTFKTSPHYIILGTEAFL